MTRKDYIKLADALRFARPHAGREDVDSFPQWSRCVEAIADTLAFDNPRFSRDRFWDRADADPAQWRKVAR